MILERLRMREEGGQPVRVAAVGAGQMGSGVVRQVARIPGMRVVGVCDLILERAWRAAEHAGLAPEVARSEEHVRTLVREGRVALSSTPEPLLPEADVLVDATGDPEAGARLALLALHGQKTLVTMNIETDATVGPVLAFLARASGSVYTVGFGDEPAVLCEMVDFARVVGFEVVCAGKGKNNRLDRTATPASVEEEARARGMSARMLAAFIDGTKTMLEMTALANATGLGVDCPGMHGPEVDLAHLLEVLVPESRGGILQRSGVVEYAIGDVAPGVFLVVTTEDLFLRRDLAYLRLGEGPDYLLYRPYHLASLELPLSIARAALDCEVTMQAQGAPKVDCVAVAKRDLAPGEVLDGIGGETVYGRAEDAEGARALKHVPIGLVDGARVRRAVPKGEPLTEEDVVLDEGKVVVQLRRLQDTLVAAGILR
jgi:predicted homoserine dehydrogenase-like protein